MPKIAYTDKRLGERKMSLIRIANSIIDEYAGKYQLTVRQLYYQFVSRYPDQIPNTEKSYKSICAAISDGRRVGLIDWSAIEDRLRQVEKNSHWSDPTEILKAVAKQFEIDKWDNQKMRCEVWVEKDALVGILEPVCNELDVPYLACRGYISDSAIWRAGRRMKEHFDRGQVPRIFHLGDHDPSGVDMTRDIAKRLALFMGTEEEYDWGNYEGTGGDMGIDEWEADQGGPAVNYDGEWEGVIRIALNMDQVRKYNPPPNPAKLSDARAKGYIAKYGDKSWELDALNPETIENLINSYVLGIRDEEVWEIACEKEAKHKARLKAIPDNWAGVCKLIDKKGKEKK